MFNMKYIIAILLVLVGYTASAQLPSNTFNSRWFTGKTRAEWIQLDSPLVNPILDTFYARYAGTQIVRIQGGDTAFWFYGGNRRWFRSLFDRDTVSLSNRINLKLNISDTATMLLPYLRRADTTNKWVQDVYVRNDSLFKFKNGAEVFLDTLGNGGSGVGTVTSVALSMPSAFTVTGSPITGAGTFSVSGAGSSLQYIRGNGTLATTDTGMIPNFYLKVRGLLSGTSPITFNQTTGAIGINNANTSGTKGAASFNNGHFADNGSGLISLSEPVSAGSCTGCNLNITSDGRIVGYADGAGGATDNVNLGTGFRILNSATQEMRTIFAGFGQRIDSVSNASGLTWSADTTRGSGLPTYYYIDSLPGENISNTSLTADGSYSQNWSENQWFVDSIGSQFLFRMGGVGNTGTRRKEFRINWGGSSFGDQFDSYNILASIKKADNSADSLTLGMMSNAGVLSMGAYNIAASTNNTFISYSANLGLINIQARDSIWIKGATPAATADSILAVVYRSPTASRVVKIPLSAAGGGGAILNNIGTGFAWAATPSGDIKRVANSNTVLWDSTSTANTLTAKADTSVLATQYDLTLINSGGGLVYNYSASEPTGSDTARIWIKTPAYAAVYDVYTYVTGYNWVRLGWLSVDGLLSYLPPVNVVIAGQSNAAGSYSGGDTARTIGVLGYSSGAINSGIDDPTEWRPVWIGLSPFFNDNNNIAHAFAKEVIRKERRIVRIISTYLGGTGIGAWNGRTTGGTTPPYLLDTLRARLDRSGIDTVHVFLWVHGESAYPTPNADGGYYSDFKCLEDSLYSPLTSGFYRDFTNIISCDMATDTSTTDINSGASPQGAMRRLLNDSDPYTSFAAAYGLSLCDASHFCGPALDTLGRRAHGAWRQMPRNMVDEEPKYTYDYVNDKKAFPTRVAAYANGMTATNITGLNLGWINNTNPVFSLDGSGSVVSVGSVLGFTNTVAKRFTVNGWAAISDDAYNLNIAGGFNHTGNPSKNVVIANYPTSFSGSSGGDESVLIGYNAGYNTTRMHYNSVGIGSGVMENFVPIGSGDFVVAIGKDALKNATALRCVFVGGLAGGSATTNQGAHGDQIGSIGYNSGATTNATHFNSFAVGSNTKYSADNQFVAGNNLEEFVMGGTVQHKFDVTGTPSNGQVFTFNSANGQFELASPLAATTLYTGDGTLAGNRNINANNLNITWSDANVFRINSDYNVISLANGNIAHTESISGSNNMYRFGYTPTIGNYTKGVGISIDTNNNIGVGVDPITTMPLYATGNSMMVQGLQSLGGNFYNVDNVNTNTTATLDRYWYNIDATSGNITITLPAASTAFGGAMGIQYVFRRVDASGNTVTIIRAGSDTINGATTTLLSSQYEVKEIQCVSTAAWAIK